MDFALDICNAVLDVWKPTKDWPTIINLPVTVSHSMPHVYASQIEFMSDNLKYRDSVVLSVHPHNDRVPASLTQNLPFSPAQTAWKVLYSETASVPEMWISSHWH